MCKSRRKRQKFLDEKRGIQMSELKSYTIYEGDVGNYTEHVVYSKSEADAYIRKLKYKRCLAMAKYCEAMRGHYLSYEEPKWFWYRKWSERWLELAEHYKEAK